VLGVLVERLGLGSDQVDIRAERLGGEAEFDELRVVSD